MAPFGLKLWENAFQTIPDISSFDVQQNFWQKVLTKIGLRGAARIDEWGATRIGAWGTTRIDARMGGRKRTFAIRGPAWREDYRREVN